MKRISQEEIMKTALSFLEEGQLLSIRELINLVGYSMDKGIIHEREYEIKAAILRMLEEEKIDLTEERKIRLHRRKCIFETNDTQMYVVIQDKIVSVLSQFQPLYLNELIERVSVTTGVDKNIINGVVWNMLGEEILIQSTDHFLSLP